VVAGVVAAASTARAQPPGDVLAYAVFAIQNVSVGSRARVTGDAGCLFGELALGQSTRLTGQAAAPNIRLRNRARATGGFFCSAIAGRNVTCAPLPTPLVQSPTFVVVGSPSNVDVDVAKKSKSTSPLSAGAYGALTAGPASEVMLAGGTYQFESIELGARARFLCLAACDVTVRGRLRIGQAGRLGAADSRPASDAIFRVAAAGERVGFEAKSRVQIRGTIYAPSGDVKLGAAVKQSGAVVGNAVTIGPRARLQGPSGG
jgi:hypothetical protein